MKTQLKSTSKMEDEVGWGVIEKNFAKAAHGRDLSAQKHASKSQKPTGVGVGSTATTKEYANQERKSTYRRQREKPQKTRNIQPTE